MVVRNICSACFRDLSKRFLFFALPLVHFRRWKHWIKFLVVVTFIKYIADCGNRFYMLKTGCCKKKTKPEKPKEKEKKVFIPSTKYVQDENHFEATFIVSVMTSRWQKQKNNDVDRPRIKRRSRRREQKKRAQYATDLNLQSQLFIYVNWWQRMDWITSNFIRDTMRYVCICTHTHTTTLSHRNAVKKKEEKNHATQLKTKQFSFFVFTDFDYYYCCYYYQMAHAEAQ